MKKIAIIGAGGAGLASAKYALDENFQCDVFEQSGVVGGTWNYTDKIGVDENSVPLNTAMYKNLRTNLPKETMAFLDFPYPRQRRSYIYQPEVLQYLNSYADAFNLRRVIKFFKQVIKVEWMAQNKNWSLTVRDAKTKAEIVNEYDAIMVCNGHYSKPLIPDIYGIGRFKGRILHSKDYRSADDFKDKIVLVIGSGPSGTDISKQLVKTAKKVIVSQRRPFYPNPNDVVIRKGAISQVLENAVHFIGEWEVVEIDVIMFCTGYLYSFPFLDDSCKIKIENNHVKPLYKHIVNIEHPTMGFIGLNYQICPFPMFDIQARYFLATLKKPGILPNKEAMYKALEEDVENQRIRGFSDEDVHQIGDRQGEYFDELANAAKIRRIPPVITSLYLRVRQHRNLEDNFEILDEETFRQIP